MRSWISFALVALVGLATAPPCSAVMCGDIIDDAQTLTADLVCTTDPGIAIAEGGSLDMGGFTLECMGTSRGVDLTGAGAKLSNGFISGCSSYGVYAAAGKHKIKSVSVSSCGAGFLIANSGSKISDCAALNNIGSGFFIPTGGNSGTRLIAGNNGGGGITLSGIGNKISDVSIACDGLSPGIVMGGDEHKLSKARISGADIGVSSAGNYNKISDVTSLNHADRGFQIFGNFNQAKKCVASSNGVAGVGFWLGAGSENTITGCRSLGSSYGIYLTGGNSIVSKNKIFGSSGTGIFANGASCVIKGNLVVGSTTIDLAEIAPGCANGDVWSKNIGTRTDSCIE